MGCVFVRMAGRLRRLVMHVVERVAQFPVSCFWVAGAKAELVILAMECEALS